MSTSTGFEIVIASDKEITLKGYLRDLCLNYYFNSSSECLSSRIRNIGDTYIEANLSKQKVLSEIM